MVNNMSEHIDTNEFRYFNDTENHDFFHFDDIDSHNFDQDVNDFCDDLRAHNITGANPSMATADYLKPLKEIMKSISPPYTVILEHCYIDKSFRDSYYRYFSSSHFNTDRFSRRLSFFQGYVTEKDLFDFSIPCVSIQKSGVECYIDKPKLIYYGSIVLNPVMNGAIGRTILDPRCLNLQKAGTLPVYIRLSRFKNHVFGRTLKVNAFPFRMQDGETTTCTEITVLNLLDYYSNHYPEYRSALPGEILDEEQRHSFQRVLPSKGMDYAKLSKLISSFGFSPRLYDRSSVASYGGSQATPEVKLRRWMYYYIESGIPVAVELGSGTQSEPGHSVICIGHGATDKRRISDAYRLGPKNQEERSFLNSADFHNSFVVVDDNNPVYNIREYEQLSLDKDYGVKALAVPLNRRMYLDAPDAESTVFEILNDDRLGLEIWMPEGYLEDKEPVVMRLFLASSHSLKSFRVRTLASDDMRAAYAYLPMPRFVWVCELYKVDEYLGRNKKKETDPIRAFGEIILDTTSVPTKKYSPKAIILAHYPGLIATLCPEDIQVGFDEMLQFKDDEPFPGFSNNLSKII